MKVLLAHRSPEDVADEAWGATLPAGLPWLASRVAADGHETSVANFSRLPWKQVEAYVAEAAPDVVGISCLTFNRHAAVRLARVVRRARPGATVILGGAHASAFPEALLARVRDVAAVAVGEAEEVLAAACARLARGEPLGGIPGLAVRGTPLIDSEPPDLDGLPRPLLGIRGAGLDPARDLVHVVAARSRRGGPARRGPTSVADEMGELASEFGIVEPRLVGPSLADADWLLELSESLRRSGVPAAWEIAAEPEALGGVANDAALENALLAARAVGLRRVRLVLDDDAAQRLPTAVLAEASRVLRGAGVASWLTLRIGGLDEPFGTAWLEAMRAVVRTLRPGGGDVEARTLLPASVEWDAVRGEEGLDAAWWFDEDRAEVPLAPESHSERAAAAITAVLREVAKEAEAGPRDLAALEGRGETAWTHLDWGDFRAAHGDREEAERRYRLAGALEQGSPFPWLRLAALFRRGKGSPEREAAALQQVLQRVRRHAPSRERLDELRRAAERRLPGRGPRRAPKP